MLIPAQIPVLRTWPDGSRADVPSVLHLNPRHANRPPSKPTDSKRGLILTFSEKSRRRFDRQLHTIDRAVGIHTMALTLPGEWEQFDQAFLHSAFKKLGQRFCAKVQRTPAWAKVALAWKKELQKRGALHWHLLFYGIGGDSALAAEVHRWFADQWNALICAGLDETERLKHAVWHHHPTNWQQVERVEYFTKYVGKAHDLTDEQCSTGRWWGFWRKDAIPWAQEERSVLDDRIAVDLNRIARKIRRKRADAAKHKALASKLELEFSPFQPSTKHSRRISPWDLHRLRAGYGPKGKGDPMAKVWLAIFTEAQQRAGVRFGKYRFKHKPGAPDPDACTITLTGHHIPETLRRAVEWSATRHAIPSPVATIRNRKP